MQKPPSSTSMTSKLPLCFSQFLITPTRPVFLPPVTMTTLLTSNLKKYMITRIGYHGDSTSGSHGSPVCNDLIVCSGNSYAGTQNSFKRPPLHIQYIWDKLSGSDGRLRGAGVELLEPGQAQLGLMVAMGAAERETPSWWLARLAGEGEDMAPA
eukprot:XP_023156587.1 uncharacterized protein LOC111589929 [Zea mays]